MAEKFNWGALGAGLQGLGGIVGGIGALEAGQASAEAYRISAESKHRQAHEAKFQTDYRIRLIHEAGAELLGEIEAETGKSGLAMTGTPLMSLVNNARKIELSAAIEKRAGQLTEFNWLQAAAADEASAKAAEKAGKESAMGSFLQAGGSAAMAIALL